MKTPIPKVDQAQSTFMWINEQAVAEITGMAVQTLRNHRFKGIGLPYYKVGRSVRYKLSDILTLMELGRIEPRK